MINKHLIIYPEIAASCLKNNEADLYIIWLLSKKIDIEGNGIVNLADILNITNKVLSLKSTWAYTKISKGENTYWRKPYGKHGKKQLGLLGINSIIKRLTPDITRCKPIKIPIKVFHNCSSKQIREIFIAIVASRYEDHRPISISTICKNTGQSESSVRNAIKSSQMVVKSRNFEVVSNGYDSKVLSHIMQNQTDPWRYRIIAKENYYQLLKQIPNSYFLNEFDRLPLCLRPKELKRNDKTILANLDPRKYHNGKNGFIAENNSVLSLTYHQ
jgi:hypothetical protein